jgi:thiol-disulfide isomerase/thioredoxin
VILAGAPSAMAGTTPTCAGLEATIVGTAGPDSGPAIDGTAGNDVIKSLGGNDVIDGGGGNDRICSGPGNDEVTTGSGSDGILAAGGDDTISTGDGSDYIDGGQGLDTCDEGTPGDEYVFGCTNPTKFLVGQKAPDFTARTAFDNKFRLSDYEGQEVMIDFSTMWCGPSNLMASQMAATQEMLRDEGVDFTYVLAEIDDASVSNPSDRVDAELMTEKWSLFDSPVLHSNGVGRSTIEMQHENYATENLTAAEFEDSTLAYPTQVFINKRGKVTEVHVGALFGEEILERYDVDGDPGDIGSSGAPLPGVDIEDLMGEVDALGISAGDRKDLKKQLTTALRGLEKRLNPKVSPCQSLSKFRRSLKKVDGLGSADRQSLSSAAKAIENKIGC